MVKRILSVLLLTLAVALCFTACSFIGGIVHTHSFGEWETVKEAACTEAGEKVRRCECGDEEREEIAALGHDLEQHEAQAPDCTDIGWAAYDTCSRCDYTTYEEIAALGHDLEQHEAQAPDCTKVGWAAYEDCSRCVYTTYKEIAALGHDFVDSVCTRCNHRASVGLEFVSNGNGTCYVSGIGTCTDSVIVIPNKSPDGDKVTSIGERAFYECSNITSVEIPNSVRRIDDYAFRYCNKLVEVINHSSINIQLKSSQHGYVAYYAKEIHTGESKIVNCNDYLFYTYDGVNYLIGYVGEDTELTLPASYNGEDYEIHNYAFAYCDNLKSVVIPDGITKMGSSVFAFSSNLVSVVIPDSITSIPSSTFSFCISFTSWVIPDSITSIGEGAFYGCYGLTSVVIPDSVTSIGEDAFSACYKLVEVINHSSLNITAGSEDYGYVALYAKEVHRGESKVVNYNDYLFYTYDGVNYLLGYVGEATELTLPESYNGENYLIYDYAFYCCIDITSVVIPDGATRIGECVFLGCDNLTSVVIGNGVTVIDEMAFYFCASITSVVIGDGVTTIGNSAFYNCTGLTTLVMGAGVKTIDGAAFANCTGLTTIVIPDGATNIGGLAFSGCSGLTSVVIPDSVTKIGWLAFENCTGLTIYCEAESKPDGWDSYWNSSNCPVVWECIEVGDYLFKTVNNINYLVKYIGSDTEIKLPYNYNGEAYEIYEYAFRGCDSLTSVVIPDSVTSIGGHAFSACTGLTSITVDENNEHYASVDGNLYSKDLTTLIRYAVGKEDASFTIPNSVTSIDDYAFCWCTGLTSVVIPNSVTSIGDYAFYWCTSLTSVVIPDSVMSIGDYAFCWCTSLTSVVIPDSVTSIGYEAFCWCTGLTSVVIPDSVTSIGERAFYGCTGLTSVVIPDSVTSIGWDAFYGCTGLTIYCEAESKPSGWSSYWNPSNCPVVWGAETAQ